MKQSLCQTTLEQSEFQIGTQFSMQIGQCRHTNFHRARLHTLIFCRKLEKDLEEHTKCLWETLGQWKRTYFVCICFNCWHLQLERILSKSGKDLCLRQRPSSSCQSDNCRLDGTVAKINIRQLCLVQMNMIPITSSNRVKEIGSTMSGRKGTDDSMTLQSQKFQIGDYLDIAITPPNRAPPPSGRMRPY